MFRSYLYVELIICCVYMVTGCKHMCVTCPFMEIVRMSRFQYNNTQVGLVLLCGIVLRKYYTMYTYAHFACFDSTPSFTSPYVFLSLSLPLPLSPPLHHPPLSFPPMYTFTQGTVIVWKREQKGSPSANRASTTTS